MIYTHCPACGGRKRRKTEIPGVYECMRKKCKAIFGKCSLGESYKLVLPYFTTEEPTETRYFDLYCLSSKGVIRRHGWYDPVTKKIVQLG